MITKQNTFLTVLFFIFLVLKLTHQITWSWWWVTAPIWGIPALLVAGGVAVVAYMYMRSSLRPLRPKIPSPRVRLPAWSWLNGVDRWRQQRGILTGRWTQAEIDEHRFWAREEAAELRKHFD